MRRNTSMYDSEGSACLGTRLALRDRQPKTVGVTNLMSNKLNESKMDVYGDERTLPYGNYINYN